MRVLICGDRNWSNEALMNAAISALNPRTDVIITGGARGADEMAEYLGIARGINVIIFNADWERFGRAAGPIRNQQMIDEGRPEYIWAFHNDIANSKGTKDMIARGHKYSIPIRLFKEQDNG